MRFATLAETFARLEESGRRLAALEIITSLFAAASHAERADIVYLLQGRLRPPYEPIEFGVGEALLVRAIARATETPPTRVVQRFKKTGDLGLTVESLFDTARKRSLTVRDAYESLYAIAVTAGSGSVEKKTALVDALLRRALPLEARYLVRIIQGRLRLGIGDATLLEAAALGALGDRKRKPLLEHAYNVRSDLGGVIELAYRAGAKGLERVMPRVGVPVRPELAQRLASAADIIKRLGTVDAEPKYDGFRLQLHRDGARTWAFSRRLEDVSAMFPDLTSALERQLAVRRVILEGEAVVYDPKDRRFLSFQVTITRKRKHDVTGAAKRLPLRLFAFDLLYAGERSYLAKPLRERHKRLAEIIRGGSSDPLAVTEVMTTSRPAELEAYFTRMLGQGLEGIVAKRPDAPYRAGARGFDWVKLKRSYQSKLRDTIDVVLIGYLTGRGKRVALGVGSLLGAVYDAEHDRFRTVAKIGSGLTEAGWKALRTRLDRYASPTKPARVDSLIIPDVWVEPRIVVEVLADEITRSPRHTAGRHDGQPGYALRFPRLLNIRTDKGPEDATTEAEVVRMYGMQGGSTRSRTV